jgi:LysM repeat protein
MGRFPFFSTFCLLLLFLSFQVSAGVKDSVGVTRINNVLYVKYLVSPGETIYGISTRYHVPVSDLLEINPELESGLKVGQVINIPYNEELVRKDREREAAAKIVHKVQVHKVQPGETLYSLAKKYNVSLDQLMKWNNMDLKVGQEIVVGYQSNTPQAVTTTQNPAAPVNSETNKTVQQPVASAKEVPAKKEETKPVRKDDFEFTEPRKDERLKDEVASNEKKETTQTVSQTVQTKAPASQVKQDAVAQSQPKQETAAPKQVAVKPKEPVQVKEVIIEKTEEAPAVSSTYPFDPELQQVLIIPFDPYLYFSDADHEIAAKSKIAPTKVREVFRRRLTALMEAPGYENIYLLGGKSQDSVSDLNRIYSSVTYNFQNSIANPYYKGPADNDADHARGSTAKNWLEKQKDKLTTTTAQTSAKAVYDKSEGQYFGVKVRNPEDFFGYFTAKYSVDYYIFINQFEVKTNYENCLDRSANNFERTFTTHFSIFDSTGKQIAGNKFKTFYNSNSNYVFTIVADNMDKIAQRILAELPPPGAGH